MSGENRSELLVNPINEKLAKEPIVLPGSPFLEIFKDFGRDELYALGLNATSVAAVSALTSNPSALIFAGPVMEKFGFFFNSSKEAIEIYTTTPPEERDHWWKYASKAFNDGLPNLARDLAFHDPLYTSLLFLELRNFPETPAWMLSTVAFMISVAAVSGGEVARNEVRYKLQTKKLEKMGFSLERHLESRFVIDEADSHQVLEELAEHFELGDLHANNYQDTYFQTNLKEYNLRKPAIRIRRRTEVGEEPGQEKIQVLYTRSSEAKANQPEQYNYFPENKDKFRLDLTDESRKHLEKMITEDKGHEVSFTREYANIPDEMLISTDRVKNTDNSYTVIEVKSFRKDEDAVNRMIMAMRHIMTNYPVLQTTHSKQYLTEL